MVLGSIEAVRLNWPKTGGFLHCPLAIGAVSYFLRMVWSVRRNEPGIRKAIRFHRRDGTGLWGFWAVSVVTLKFIPRSDVEQVFQYRSGYIGRVKINDLY
jgi:hypothetical protein